WRPEHGLDPLRTCGKHHETIKAESNAAGFGHEVEGGEKIFVDWVAFAMDALLFSHFSFKAHPLFGGIGQFAKAIGEFDATGIDLKAFRNASISRHAPRQSRLAGRITVKNCYTTISQLRLDLFDEDLGEKIRPA